MLGLTTSKKTGKAKHEVGLSDLMVHALQEHKKTTLFNTPESPVFSNAFGGVLSGDTMRVVIRKAMETVGLKYIPRATGVHMLRHTAGSYLWASTGDIKRTSDQLGHADIKTTANIYTHANDLLRLESAEVLSEPFAQILPRNPVN